MPNEIIYYMGDTARCPYGPRPEHEVRKFTWQMAEFLVKRDIKMLVIACNTATAVVLEEMQAILDIPVVGVISPPIPPVVVRQPVGETENSGDRGQDAQASTPSPSSTTGTVELPADPGRPPPRRRRATGSRHASPAPAKRGQGGGATNGAGLPGGSGAGPECRQRPRPCGRGRPPGSGAGAPASRGRRGAARWCGRLHERVRRRPLRRHQRRRVLRAATGGPWRRDTAAARDPST